MMTLLTDDMQRSARLAQIAEMYYIAGMKQSVIAKRYGVSTMQVSRLLREAVKTGIVEVKVNHPLPFDIELARALSDAYELDGAVVVTSNESSNVKAEVAQAAASHVLGTLRVDSILAIPWSSTLALLAQALPKQRIKGLTVVQTFGALTLSAEQFNPYDAFQQIGHKLSATMYPLHAPALLASKDARDALMADPSVKRVLDLAREADMAICGIGTVDRDSTFFRTGYINELELQELVKKGASGDILGQFFDLRGNIIDWKFSENFIGLSLSELKRIPQVTVVAGGREKLIPLLGALNGGFCNNVITDSETAKLLLKEKEKAVLTWNQPPS